MDRKSSGFIDILSLIDIIYDGKGSEGRGVKDDRERGGERGLKNNLRDIVVKRNEARIVFRKRPDLLEEVLLNVVRIYKDRTSTVQDLLKEFKRSDYDQKGKLAKVEFLNCLSNFGFKLRKEIERDLVDSLTDHEREGRTERGGGKGVNYVDFISALNAEHDAENNADDTLDMLKKRCFHIYIYTYTYIYIHTDLYRYV
jgi:hypothetical protein